MPRWSLLALVAVACGPRATSPDAGAPRDRRATPPSSDTASAPTQHQPPAPSSTDGFHTNRTTATFALEPAGRSIPAKQNCAALAGHAGQVFAIGDGGSIQRLQTEGQPPGVELGAVPAARFLAANDEHLFIGQDRGGGAGAVLRVRLTGGKIEQVFETGAVSALGVDGADLYVAVDRQAPIGDDRLLRIALKDGEPVELAGDLGRVAALAVDPTDVYLLVFGSGDPLGNRGGLVRIPKSGGAPAVLASAQSPVALAMDDTHVFFTDAGPATTRPNAPCPPPRVCPVATSNPVMVEGRVVRVAKADGSTLVLADKREDVGALVVDRASVVFAADGALMRVAKAGGSPKTWWSPPARHIGAMTVNGKAVVAVSGGAVVSLE